MRNNAYQTAMQQLRFDTHFAEKTAARMIAAKHRPKRRWAISIAACLLFAVTLVACIPEARAAVGAWFTKVFSTENYMGEERGSRSPEPAMDAVITRAGNNGREIVIHDIHDSDRARALANDFGVRLEVRTADVARVAQEKRVYSVGALLPEGQDVAVNRCAFARSLVPFRWQARAVVTPYNTFGTPGAPIASNWTRYDPLV